MRKSTTSEGFDAKLIARFADLSASAETRRAYHRVAREFFLFVDYRDPATIAPSDVQRWRDSLAAAKKSPATIAFKLSVVRSLFHYLQRVGVASSNPALTALVPAPTASERLRGRSLSPQEARRLLAGPDQSAPEGARDYALLLLILRTAMRVGEACCLTTSSVRWSHGRWTLRLNTGARGKTDIHKERTIPLPEEVKGALDHYLRLDAGRRGLVGSGASDAYLFQPHTNYRTLVFDKPLSSPMIWRIVKKWGDYTGLGKLSPHDLRRTAITKALEQGLSYRQVQMMSGHKDAKTVMRYDRQSRNLERNAVNFLSYEEEGSGERPGDDHA